MSYCTAWTQPAATASLIKSSPRGSLSRAPHPHLLAPAGAISRRNSRGLLTRRGGVFCERLAMSPSMSGPGLAPHETPPGNDCRIVANWGVSLRVLLSMLSGTLAGVR